MTLLTPHQRSVIKILYPEAHREYGLLLENLAELLEKEVRPTAASTDREGRFPRRSIQLLFRHGFTSMPFPEECGGLGLPHPIYIAGVELVAKACASTALSTSIHGVVCEGVHHFADQHLKDRYLAPLIRGEKLAAFALTEPQAGSDARSMKTTAVLEDEEYVLNGTKMFITNAGEADVYIVFAKSGSGHCALLVDKDAEGISVGKEIRKLGVRGSPLKEVVFENCRIPSENLVGREGEGFEYAKRMLDGGRIGVAAIATGIAQTAFERALRYGKERVQFGRPIADFQATRMKLAQMATEIAAARLLTYHASALKERGEGYSVEAAQAKVYASEMALRVCDEVIQIHGGYGYADEFDVHRHWRDAKLLTIGEGTSEILRLLIAHQLLRE